MINKIVLLNEEGEELSLADMIPSPVNMEDELFKKYLQDEVRKEINKLPPRECKVIRMLMGIDDGKPKTLEEIGKTFGVTRERIRQIEMRALCILSKNKELKELWNDRT